MSEGIGCLWSDERISLLDASEKFDDQLCIPCPFFDSCKAYQVAIRQGDEIMVAVDKQILNDIIKEAKG